MSLLVAPLYEGTFSVGLDKEFHPMERDGKPAKNSLRISIQPFVVQNETHTILFDTGIGELGVNTSISTLCNNLAEHGIDDVDVTDIVLSHLHFDHLGGLAHRTSGFWELTFPEARIWLSMEEMEKIKQKGDYLDEEKTEMIFFLLARADLRPIQEMNNTLPELHAETVGGHTEFHQAIWYDDGDQCLLMAGDVLPTKGHVNQKFAAKYDFDPKQSIASRQRLVKEAYERNATILAYHSSETPIFRLSSHDPKMGYSIDTNPSTLIQV